MTPSRPSQGPTGRQGPAAAPDSRGSAAPDSRGPTDCAAGRLTPDASPRGRVLDARLHLLSRQMVDREEVPIGTVDDLELGPVDGESEPVGTTVQVTALLTGPVLLTRILGGRPPATRRVRVPWRHVAGLGPVVRLGVSGQSLDATWAERWVRDHIVARIPGGRHAPE